MREDMGLEPKTLAVHHGSKIIITYATVMWWLRLKYKSSRAKLCKLQRLACLGITGAMQTAPRAAVVALLSHPPLCLKMETEAQAGISGLICNEQWKSTSTYKGT